MSKLKEKLELYLDEIGVAVKEGTYVHSADVNASILEKLSRAAKMQHLMDDGDRDFLAAAKMAVAAKLPWR